MLCYHKSLFPWQRHCNLITMLFSFYRFEVQPCLLSNLQAEAPFLPQGVCHIIQRRVVQKLNTKQQIAKELHFTKQKNKLNGQEILDKEQALGASGVILLIMLLDH